MFDSNFSTAIGKPLIMPLEVGVPYPETANVRPLPGETPEAFSSIEKIHNFSLELMKFYKPEFNAKPESNALPGAGNLEVEASVSDFSHMPASYKEYGKDIKIPKEFEAYSNPYLAESLMVEKKVVNQSYFTSALKEFEGTKKIDELASLTQVDRVFQAAALIGESFLRLVSANEGIKKIDQHKADIHNKAVLGYALSLGDEFLKFGAGAGQEFLVFMEKIDKDNLTDLQKKIMENYSKNLEELKKFYEQDRPALKPLLEKLGQEEIGRFAGTLGMKISGKKRWQQQQERYEAKVEDEKKHKQEQERLEAEAVMKSRMKEKKILQEQEKRKVKKK